MSDQNRPYLIPVPAFSDDRGVFFGLSNNLAEGLKIARVYLISNFGKGIIRGFHKHQKETKFFFISQGAAKFVAVRDGDEKDRMTFVLSDRNPVLLVIPPGWYNGWMSLEDNTVLTALSTSSYQESAADDERVEPYAFGDVWKVIGR